MAERVMKLDLSYAEAGDVTGKVVNVYDTYENALAHGATGLITTMKAVDNLTGLPTGSAITQEAKVTGIVIDINSKLICALVDTEIEYWGAVVSGRAVGPFQIIMPSYLST